MVLSEALLRTQVIPLIMARFRSGLRPINSVKNIVDSTLIGVAAGLGSSVNVATTVNDYTGGVADVPIGCKISSVYLFLQILPATGTANVDWYIWKGPLNINATMPVPGATGGAIDRKYILHEEKGIPGNAADGAYPLTFKGVIKIPRGRQRFGEGDRIQIKTVGADVHNVCLKCIYKFYQ